MIEQNALIQIEERRANQNAGKQNNTTATVTRINLCVIDAVGSKYGVRKPMVRTTREQCIPNFFLRAWIPCFLRWYRPRGKGLKVSATKTNPRKLPATIIKWYIEKTPYNFSCGIQSSAFCYLPTTKFTGTGLNN